MYADIYWSVCGGKNYSSYTAGISGYGIENTNALGNKNQGRKT
jgi:hypothetical protein